MTPAEKTIVKALVAVAWADGNMAEPESSVLEGMLAGFDASADEERELLTYAKAPRRLDEIAVSELSRDDREMLLGNAALLVHADGTRTSAEADLLRRLASLLAIDDDAADEIVASVRGGRSLR